MGPLPAQSEAPKQLSSAQTIRILDEVTGINRRIGEKEQQAYRELGPDHVDEQAAAVARRRALRTLEQLGY